MRTWTGCLTCRSRKVKCDERRPRCMNCEKTRVKCIPSDHFVFKHWRNPFISKGAKNAGSSTFESDHIWVDITPLYGFLDETSIIAAEYHEVVDGEGSWGQTEGHEGQHRHQIYYDSVRNDDGENSTTPPLELQAATPAVFNWNFSCGDTQNISRSPNIDQTSSSAGYSASLYPEDVENAGHRTSVPLDDSSSILPMYTPNSLGTIHEREDAAGKALLSMRNHDLGAPFIEHLSPHSYSPIENSLGERNARSIVSPVGTVLAQQPVPMILTSKEEADLLRRFSAEVGTWMDLSDLSQTFSKKVCRLAVHDPLLKAASMACAAKQLYLVGKLEDGLHIARTNYNIAISLLINHLQDLDEQSAEYGFAAIVICSCYEMLDAPTADWQRHLDGVFSVSRVQRVNGSSGGISQAAFWSIARQEVVCAIINRSKLRFDPELWLVDLQNIGQEGSEDLVNNQVLTILARVVNFVALSETCTFNKRIAEWQTLYDLLEHWSNSKGHGIHGPSLGPQRGRQSVSDNLVCTECLCFLVANVPPRPNIALDN